MEIKPKLDTCDEILSAFTTMNSSVGGQISKRYQRSLVSRLQQNLLVLFSLCRIREPPPTAKWNATNEISRRRGTSQRAFYVAFHK